MVKQKGFYPYDYMSNFEQFKEELPSKESFLVRYQVKKVVIKNMSMFLRFGINLK